MVEGESGGEASSAAAVIVPTADGSMRAVVARPASGTPPHPGVVVLHELWGLNDDVRRVSERLARAGYVAIAPDLYSVGNKAVCIARTIRALANHGTGPVEHADAARSWLADQADVDSERIGAIGFCMGGGFALALGVRSDLRAVSVNYGHVPENAAQLAGVCPVVASYGAADRRFSPEGRRLELLLEELGVTHDVKFYDGATHSFMNDAGHPVLARALRPAMAFAYDPAAAEDAWARIFAFLDEHMRAA